MLKLVLALLALAGSGWTHRLNSQERYMRLVKQINWIREESEHNKTFHDIIERHNNKFGFKGDLQDLPDLQFKCEVEKSPEIPTSVHELRPADIKIVGAIGDSVTAALGAKAHTIIGILREDRGVSWSMGGDASLDEKVTTMPNVLKKFNPALHGYSFGTCSIDGDCTQFNRALSGDEAAGMPEQAKDLVTTMKNDKTIDFQKDWKIINFLIGGNDLCQFCYDPDWFSADEYIGYIRVALNHFLAESPRTLVNLHLMFDVTQLPQVSDSIGCDFVQGFVCACAVDDYEKKAMQDAYRKYNQRIYNLIATGRYEREDFTVVIQEHLLNAQPAKKPGTDEVDASFWAPDCFHPSSRGQFAFGQSLWNCMMEPVGQKRKTVNWDTDGNILCPTKENPYIWTNKNSPGGYDYLRQVAKMTSPKQTNHKYVIHPRAHTRSEYNESRSHGLLMGLLAVAGVVIVMTLVGVLLVKLKLKRQSDLPTASETPSVGISNPVYEENIA